MVYGLPTDGEANWGTKVNASIEAVKTTADAAEAEIAGRLSEANLSDSHVAFVTGTIGDGVTDDAAAIQAGINAVLAAGGGELVGDTRKTYAVASQLTQPSGVTLRDFAFKRITNVFDVLVNSDPVAGNTRLGLVNVTVDGDRATGALTKTNAAHRFCGVRWRNVADSTLDGVLVRGTVNGEIQAEGNRAAIALEDCIDVTVDSRTEDNDGTGLILFGTTHDCTIAYHKSVADLGSGFSTQSTTYDNYLGIIEAVDNGIGGEAGAYSAISVNGPGYTATHLESLRANGAGINIGHETQAADGFRAMFVKATDSGLSDLIVRGSDDVEIAVAQLDGGGFGGIAGHGNARIYPECSNVRIGTLTAKGGNGDGVLIEGGTGHAIESFEVSGCGAHGIESKVPVRLGKGRSYNNGQTGEAAGVVLVGVTEAQIGQVEIFDAQATKTQDYGLWLAGGGGPEVVLSGLNAHDNLTADYHTTSSAVEARRVLTRIGASGRWLTASTTFAKAARANTAQAVASFTVTPVVWDVVYWEDVDVIDIAGATPSRITIPATLAGRRIRIDAALDYAADATGIRRIQIMKNGATVLSGANVNAPSAGDCDLGCSAYDIPVAGDYYEVIAYTGTALDLLAGGRNWVAITLA